MFRQEQEIFQMFGGYLHQDWMHEYIWEEGEKPYFKAAIEAYKEDNQNVPEKINTVIQELEELIGRNYNSEILENEVFMELDINIVPMSYGYTHQQFLQEVLKILMGKKLEKTEGSNPQTTQDDLSHFSPYVYPSKPDHIIPTGIEGLLTVYFAKDYDELVEQYGFRRLITQIVAQYKEDQHPAAVKHCLNEVSILVSHEQNEKYLRDKIVNEYGVKIPISKLGGSYQIFLERLHEELLGKRIYS